MAKGTTVAILTALDLEYEAVRAHLTDVKRYTHRRGTLWEIGTVPDGSCKIALGEAGKGNHSSAVLAARAIEELEPDALFFVGVAGTPRDDINLGDVVVATHVYAYHSGTSDDDQFRARPRAWEAPHKLNQLAGDIKRSASWRTLLPNERGPAPEVHRAPIAAGETVLKSRTSAEATRIDQHYNDTAAVEMEGAGVAQAAQLSDRPAMLIRGISDRANADKHAADRAGWQHVAAQRAAAFAITLASELAAQNNGPVPNPRTPAEESGRHAATNPPGGAQSSFSNLAQGNAQVGVQASQVFGGVHLGQQNAGPPLDLENELKNLRLALEDAHRAGKIDDDIHESAQAELAIAAESCPAGDAKPESRFVLALKRLKGLLEDVADFGAKIATILNGIGPAR